MIYVHHIDRFIIHLVTHEDKFLLLEKQKSYVNTWVVYYLHLWLGILDNLTDFVIIGLSSEAIIDSDHTKFSFTNNFKSYNPTSTTKVTFQIIFHCLLLITLQLTNTRKIYGKNRKLGKINWIFKNE